MVLGIQHTALFFAAINNKPGFCLPLIAKGADLRVRNCPSNQSPLSHYGFSAYPHPAPLVKAQRVAELEAAFRTGCHPSQVQPRKDENWAKRWPPDECGERAARWVRRALQQALPLRGCRLHGAAAHQDALRPRVRAKVITRLPPNKKR